MQQRIGILVMLDEEETHPAPVYSTDDEGIATRSLRSCFEEQLASNTADTPTFSLSENFVSDGVFDGCLIRAILEEHQFHDAMVPAGEAARFRRMVMEEVPSDFISSLYCRENARPVMGYAWQRGVAIQRPGSA